MDEENNLENPGEDIEFLEDDFVEVVDLDGEGEVADGTIKTLALCTSDTWTFDWKQSVHPHFCLIVRS